VWNVLGDKLNAYLNARLWALSENVKDMVDAAQNGYWLDIIHFIGIESSSELSHRMEVRRAYARQQLIKPNPNRPHLEPIGFNR
jgi:hypothetical protein